MNRLFARSLAVGALLTIFAACQSGKPPAAVNPNDPAELDIPVEALLTIWNSNDVQMLDSVVTPDFTRSAPDGNITGPEAMKALVQQYHTSYPDFHLTGDMTAYSDSLGFLQWTAIGTNTGDGQTMATGKAIRISGVSVFTFRKGRIASERVFFDNADLQSQLAANPANPAKQVGTAK